MERSVARRHARHRARPSGRADGAVRRRRADRVVVAAGQRGQRDHQLRRPDRRRRVGRSSASAPTTHVPLGGPDERPGVHVPGARRERQGRGRVQLAVGARAPAAPARRARRHRSAQRGDKTITVSWGAPGNGGDPIIEYQVQILSTGATNTTTGTSLRWANLPNGQPQQFQVRARNRGRLGRRGRRPRRPSCRAASPTRRRSVAATRGDQSAGGDVVGAVRPGLRDHRLHRPRQRRRRRPTSAAAQTSATFGGLTNGTTLHVHRRRPQRGRRQRRQRRRPTPSCRPARRARRRSPSATPDTGRVDRRVERGQPQRQRRSRSTSCRSTAAVGERRHRDVVHQRPASPTARRTRSRSAPSTTSAPVPAATP